MLLLSLVVPVDSFFPNSWKILVRLRCDGGCDKVVFLSLGAAVWSSCFVVLESLLDVLRLPVVPPLRRFCRVGVERLVSLFLSLALVQSDLLNIPRRYQ